MSNKRQSFLSKYQQEIVAIAVLFLFAGIIFTVFFFLGKQNEIIPAKNYLPAPKVNIEPPETVVGEEESYPVAVMIDNFITVRPQAGLSQASFIYETLVEGGATRLMAIYNVNKDIKAIGPVRSARPYFVDWALEYNALYVHAGGSPQALQNIYDWQVNDLNEISGYGTTYFNRNYNLAAPHNLFTDSNRLVQAIEKWELTEVNYNKWQYGKNIDIDFIDNNSDIYIDFSGGVGYDAAFVYSSTTNQYIRIDVDEPLIDTNTGEPVTADNVIIQFIPGEELSGGKGRLALNIYGEGKGLFFQNGKVEEIFWQKQTRGKRTKYKGEGGLEIKLNPGLTWIVVVPGDREVIY